jgi:hypothetical protein
MHGEATESTQRHRAGEMGRVEQAWQVSARNGYRCVRHDEREAPARGCARAALTSPLTVHIDPAVLVSPCSQHVED